MAWDKEQPGKFKSGDPLPGAADLNQMNEAGIRRISGRGVGNFGNRYFVAPQRDPGNFPDHRFFHERFRVLEIHDNYLLCEPLRLEAPGWWTPYEYTDRSTPLETWGTVYVALPQLIQREFWDGTTIGAATYYWDALHQRWSIGSDFTYLETVQQPYFVGDTILAMRGVTGTNDPQGRPIFWRDVNEASRVWEQAVAPLPEVWHWSYRTDCVLGVQHRYKQKITLSPFPAVGPWQFDSYQGCCECDPDPPDFFCCEEGETLPASLSVTLYGTMNSYVGNVTVTLTVSATLSLTFPGYTIASTPFVIQGRTFTVSGNIFCDPTFEYRWRPVLSVDIDDPFALDSFQDLSNYSLFEFSPTIVYGQCDPPCVMGYIAFPPNFTQAFHSSFIWRVVVGDCGTPYPCEETMCLTLYDSLSSGSCFSVTPGPFSVGYLGNGLWVYDTPAPATFVTVWHLPDDTAFVIVHVYTGASLGTSFYTFTYTAGEFACPDTELALQDASFGADFVVACDNMSPHGAFLTVGFCEDASGTGTGTGTGTDDGPEFNCYLCENWSNGGSIPSGFFYAICDISNPDGTHVGGGIIRHCSFQSGPYDNAEDCNADCEVQTGTGSPPNCSGGSFCVVYDSPFQTTVAETTSGVYVYTDSGITVTLDTTTSPATLLYVDNGTTEEAFYECDSFDCGTGGLFTRVSGDPGFGDPTISVSNGDCV